MVTSRLRLGFLLLAGCAVTLAQTPPQLRETSYSAHPLTPREGKKIVSAALYRQQQAGRKPDCSHLTHNVYTLAGYPYPYASSFDLYAGIGSFVRVAKAQPGDLIVWRGHVGIVVDPVEHSFYSSVRSGLRTEFYDTPSWKARGPARFYRYAAAKRPGLVLAGNRPANSPRDSAPAGKVPIVEDAHETPADSANEAMENSGFTNSPVISPESPPTRAAFEIPSSILVVASQSKPTNAEIADAISELNNATGDLLREQDLSRLRQNLIIYDNLTLDRSEIKGKHGSAQARIESRVTLDGEGINQVRRYEELRWELLHTNEGWQVLAPKNAVFVPRDVAIRILAARLAALTQETNSTGSDSHYEQGQIVRVLGALLGEI
jgi:hypothetical protein